MVNKKIITKVGDVFCAELNETHKCFFQYISNDYEELNSSVIRVFLRKYSIDYKPIINEILNDTIAFYAHTVLRAGIKSNAWYKVGVSKIDEESFSSVVFAQTSEISVVNKTDIKMVNPLENWFVHFINKPMIKVYKLPDIYINTVEIGGVIPFEMIVTRMKYGYYKSTDIIYDIIKRVPLSNVNSYTKRSNNGVTYYYNFLGEFLIKEIIVTNNRIIKLSKNEPMVDSFILSKKKFHETNWNYYEFISEIDFNLIWDS